MTDTDIDRDAIVSVIAEMDDARRCWATRLRAALGADATAAEATDIHDLVIVDRNKLGEMLGKWGLPPWPDTADPDGPWTRGSDLDCSGMAQAISSDMDALIAAAPVTPAELLASIEAAWGVIAIDEAKAEAVGAVKDEATQIVTDVLAKRLASIAEGRS